MKIGILTYHYAYNFGANLQALSTVGRLKMMGHAPIVINWRPKDVEDRYRRETPSAQAAVHEKYICDHLPVSTVCRTSDDIAEVIDRDGIDAIIIGSDAVLSLCPQTYFSIRRFRRVYNPNRSLRANRSQSVLGNLFEAQSKTNAVPDDVCLLPGCQLPAHVPSGTAPGGGLS